MKLQTRDKGCLRIVVGLDKGVFRIGHRLKARSDGPPAPGGVAVHVDRLRRYLRARGVPGTMAAGCRQVVFIAASPDGKTIYFLSGPCGFNNVWVVRFDVAAGKRIREPFQVSEFASSRLMVPRWIAPVGLSLTKYKLVSAMAQRSGTSGCGEVSTDRRGIARHYSWVELLVLKSVDRI